MIGTHGRGIWIMEDITPLEQMSDAVLASNVHLFPAHSAVSYNPWTPQGWTPGIFSVPNPPQGVRIRYWLGQELEGEAPLVTEEAEDAGSGPNVNGPNANGSNARARPAGSRPSANGGKAHIAIVDGAGEIVRELDGEGTVGLHEVVWDLRVEPAYEQEPGQGGFGGGGGFFRGGGPQGPRVLPGMYTVRLEAGGESLETTAEVRLDPRVEISRGDLMARQEAMMRAYALAGPVNDASQTVGRIREQLGKIRAQIKGREDVPEALKDEVKAIGEELDEINDDVGDARRGAGARGTIERYHSAPTADALYQIEAGWDALPGAIERLNDLITDRMPALFDMLSEAALRPDLGEPIALPVPPSGR